VQCTLSCLAFYPILCFRVHTADCSSYYRYRLITVNRNNYFHISHAKPGIYDVSRLVAVNRVSQCIENRLIFLAANIISREIEYNS